MEMYICQLEKTMLDYHREKMNEINKIITDTWKEIYDGIDIRNIEIKSSEDENTVPKRGNKSYNYRIVMHTTSNN